MRDGSKLNSLWPISMSGFLRRMLIGADKFRISVAQSGEDININAIIVSLFGIRKGFYVDVGAFHPTLGSNTHYLYRKGWSGINIDPRPGSMNLFNKLRTRDINLEVGISSVKQMKKYYFIDNDSPMNSFSEQTLNDNQVRDKVTKVIDIQVLPLSEITDRYLPKNTKIDFLNIDTEGFEIDVLSSIDWSRHSPLVIAIEQNSVLSFEDVIRSETYRFLTGKGYIAVGKNMITSSVSTVIYSKS